MATVANRGAGVAPGQAWVMVAIPAHNEGAFIGPVVEACLPLAREVWVVDDGSTDDTREVARRFGARVLARLHNGGYGAALASCFRLAERRGAGILVTLDGDGQHRPDELCDLLAPLQRGQADVALGSRFLGRPTNVPRYRRFGIDVITGLYNLGHPPISDAQCGFRAYNQGALSHLCPGDPGMGASVEILIRARGRGMRIVEVPVSCRYHPGGSSIHPVRHGVGVAMKVVEYRARRRLGMLPSPPPREGRHDP